MQKSCQGNPLEQNAVYRMREIFAKEREYTVFGADGKEQEFISRLAEQALFPEKVRVSFSEEKAAGQKKEDLRAFSLAAYFEGKQDVARLITCGGVDDGKSTLIGRILYEMMSDEEKKRIEQDERYLRADKSIDYALLAGVSEEEAKQGITVQVSYSKFLTKDRGYLIADVPGHEEYTRNMAYAAAGAKTAVIMIAANKGIVPQTRRHTRICCFMGITTLIFAVNKMDMINFDEQIFAQITEEIQHMLQEYKGCRYKIVPVAAKTGENIKNKSEKLSWYRGKTLTEVLAEKDDSEEVSAAEAFCMPIQRVCKSSQIKGQEIKRRVIQGEVFAGKISVGDELLVYPSLKKTKVEEIYRLNQKADTAEKGEAAGLVLSQELDTARGSVLVKEDAFQSADRIEADILWTSDDRMSSGKRYTVKIGTKNTTAVITRICYQIDVNTGEHKYSEYLTKNAMARCELCFQEQIMTTPVNENRRLGTFYLYEREKDENGEEILAGYGNVMLTISENAFKENSQKIEAKERENALGQKAGMILFPNDEKVWERMNYAERYLLRMGFHTIQTVMAEKDARELGAIRQLLDAGLIVLIPADETEAKELTMLLNEDARICDCRKENLDKEHFALVLKRMKKWASELL